MLMMAPSHASASVMQRMMAISCEDLQWCSFAASLSSSLSSRPSIFTRLVFLFFLEAFRYEVSLLVPPSAPLSFTSPRPPKSTVSFEAS
jgi:hypothetical protein